MPWPKTADDTTDWEAVFETGESGLIPLAEQAQTLDALRAIGDVIIQMLFTRKGDESFRLSYGARLDAIVPLDGLGEGGDFASARAQVLALLRAIKDERARKAAEYRARLAAEAAAKQKEEEQIEAERRKADEAASAPPPSAAAANGNAVKNGPPDETALAHFAEAFCDYYRERFQVLRRGIPEKMQTGAKVPFLLSPVFEDHFTSILAHSFVPEMAKASRGLLTRAAAQPSEDQRKFIIRELENRNTRAVLWESWQKVWEDLLGQKKMPDKPKAEEKNGLMQAIGLKKEKAKPTWMKKELTPEEWKAEVARVKAANRKAERLWQAIAQPSNAYMPPEDGDMKLLKELFGRSPAAIEKQVTALRQIVEQGGNVGRVFDQYLKTARNVDLSLLSACMIHPNLFLGEKGALKQMFKGFDDAFKQHHFRLTLRFLGSQA